VTGSLRFGFFTTFYPPYSFGGDGIDVQRMAQALVRRGHTVTVVHDRDAYRALAGHADPPRSTPEAGVEVIGLESRLGALSPLLTQQFGRPVVHGRRLDALCRARTFDVVTFHNVSLLGGPGTLRLGGDAVRVYLAHEHWLVCPTHVLWRHNREACDERACLRCVLHYRRPPQLWRYTGWLDRQLPQVDTFVARSEFSRQKHREFGFPRPMEVLPLWVPDDWQPASAQTTAARPHARPYFLFVGRLERVKGAHTLLPVFARYPDADLIVVGDGTEAPGLRDQAAANPRIRFVGALPNADLGPYYQHALAAIVPSVGFETFGLVLLEAFRHGTPVIARRLGPFPEIVTAADGGELFTTDDELVAAMARLQHDPAHRTALGERGAAATRSIWSEPVVLNRYLDIVARAAQARAARLGRAVPAWAA
jgi:glycosyltransferase involved in cell wall biosynthesis